jgi:hypothetical protein
MLTQEAEQQIMLIQEVEQQIMLWHKRQSNKSCSDTRGGATNYALTRKPIYRTKNQYCTNNKEQNRTTQLTNLLQNIKIRTALAR